MSSPTGCAPRRGSTRIEKREVRVTRPTLATTDSDNLLRRRWRARLPRLVDDVSRLYFKRQVYRELLDVVNSNSAILNPAPFFNWLRDNYILAICIGIRRHTDADSRSISLRRMLEDLKQRPSAVNRRAFRALYRRHGRPAGWADATFDRLVGHTHRSLTAALVQTDIDAISAADARIRLFVNKRLAHAAPRSAIRKIPTFTDADRALEIIDRVLIKYHDLLTGHGLATAYATPQYDWRQVLYKPWIADPRSRPKRHYAGPRSGQM